VKAFTISLIIQTYYIIINSFKKVNNILVTISYLANKFSISETIILF